MILKPVNERIKDFDTLNLLLRHPAADERTILAIEHEIKKIESKIKVEQEVGFSLRAKMKDFEHWHVIHGLELDLGGVHPIIDHLIINTQLDFYLCTSRYFSQGVTITPSGDFLAHRNQEQFSLPSPFEDNERIINAFRRFMDIGEIPLPIKWGKKLTPTFHNVVLISKNARIYQNPKDLFEFAPCIMKTDALLSYMKAQKDTSPSLLSFYKSINPRELMDFCKNLLDFHKPQERNWFQKFGLSPQFEPLPQRRIDFSMFEQKERVEIEKKAPIREIGSSNLPTAQAISENFACEQCGATISLQRAVFCWEHPQEFDQKIKCTNCNPFGK